MLAGSIHFQSINRCSDLLLLFIAIIYCYYLRYYLLQLTVAIHNFYNNYFTLLRHSWAQHPSGRLKFD